MDVRVLNEKRGSIVLLTNHGDEIDFVYKVRVSSHAQPGFVNSDDDEDSAEDANDTQTYYRAEVHLGEGGQDYDIMGWSTEGVINDIVSQYHRHMHFLHSLR